MGERDVAGRDVRCTGGDLFAEFAYSVGEDCGALGSFAEPEGEVGRCTVGVFDEDSACGTDMNFVMTAGYKMVEVQATAEHQMFDDGQLNKMLSMAKQGVQSLIAKQQAILGTLTLRQ